MATVVGEQGHREAIVEACGKEVLPPGLGFRHGNRQVARNDWWLKAVQAQLLDLVVGLGALEVPGQGRSDTSVRDRPMETGPGSRTAIRAAA
jgi:hypothetical protein